uniref:Uncharacterized protein n=1 Tax=viral metagenome TaxID=1070528 RepID=A0A6M3K1R6_9ZZZZ
MMTRFDHVTTQAAPGQTWTKKEPVRPATLQADVIVPAFQALISGACVFLVAGAFCLALHIPVTGALILGGLAMTGVWFGHLLNWKSLLWSVESATQLDINHDGMIGQPPARLFVDVSDEMGEKLRELGSYNQNVVLDWAQMALRGGSVGYETWKRRFAHLPDESDGEDNYRAFRQRLGVLKWANEKGTHSIELTTKGRAVFSAWLERGVVEGLPLLEGRGAEE